MDYTEFHETMCKKYLEDLERQEHQWYRRKSWLYAVLALFTLLVTTVLAPVVFRLIR